MISSYLERDTEPVQECMAQTIKGDVCGGGLKRATWSTSVSLADKKRTEAYLLYMVERVNSSNRRVNIPHLLLLILFL